MNLETMFNELYEEDLKEFNELKTLRYKIQNNKTLTLNNKTREILDRLIFKELKGIEESF